MDWWSRSHADDVLPRRVDAMTQAKQERDAAERRTTGGGVARASSGEVRVAKGTRERTSAGERRLTDALSA